MKHVSTVIATSYQMSLISGRTTPGVFICEDPTGHPVGEYVVKFRHNIETGNAGLLRELVGNLLADQLGIETPDPGIVEIGSELAPAISDQKVSQVIKNSVGKNYGSRYLTGGYYTWPNDKIIPSSLKQAATDIFVFDALIQNPDRKRGRSNILWKSDVVTVIDHEMAFSFLLAIPAIKRQWDLSEQPYLGDHIFFMACDTRNLSLDG